MSTVEQQEQQEQTDTLKVQIGTWDVEYVLRQTDAPDDYDAARTLTVYDAGDEGRYVLIPKKELQWHIDRYRSGLHWCKDPEYVCAKDMEDHVIDAILDAMAP